MDRLGIAADPLHLALNGALDVVDLRGRPVYSLGRPVHAVWGHWLLDVMPSVWMFQEAMRDGTIEIQDPIYVAPHGLPASCIASLKLIFNMTDEQLVFFDELTSVIHSDNLYVASSMRSETRMAPPTNGFISAAHTKMTAGPTPPEPKKLFVSRSTVVSWSNRVVEQEGIFEEMATKDGFVVIHPENMSFEEQLTAFGTASIIVGPQGSGLHNSLLAPSSAIVFELNVPDTGGLQSGISAVRGHRMAYLQVDQDVQYPGGRRLSYSVDGFRGILDRIQELAAIPAE